MTAATKTSILKKITLADVMPSRSPKDFDGYNAETKQFPTQLAMRIIGQVRAVEPGKTTFGDYWKFKGNFMAHNAKGEAFRSGVCILPEPADVLTKDALDANGGNEIQLAFDVMVAYDKGDRGYKYIVQPLAEAEPSDPLAALAASINEKFALPSPAQAQLNLDESTGELTEATDKPAEAEAEAPKGKAKGK